MSGNDGASILNSILGPGSAFVGHLQTSGLVRIEGYLSGSLITDGAVVISRDARCEGPIKARMVVVGGIVKGALYASELVELLPGAMVVGDIFAPRLRLDASAVIHGDCRVAGRNEDIGKALEAFMAAHGGIPVGARESLADPRWRRSYEDTRKWTK
jgi:cytoskeletal protein CcmA (bactofilin family)